MKPITQNAAILRHGYLPTDNVGRLFCWPCWDWLKKESPRLAGHHDDEVCDHCGKTIKPDKTPIWKIERMERNAKG